MKRTLWLSWALMALCPAELLAQGRELKEAVVIFKDGFFVKGRAGQKKDFIVDPYSGTSIPIPAGDIYIDDVVRRIFFSMAQVQEVLDVKEGDRLKDQLFFGMKGTLKRGGPLPTPWEFETRGEWNDKWERTATIRSDKGRTDILQRMTVITPSYMLGLTVGYDLDFALNTKEFDPEVTCKLLLAYLRDQLNMKDFERRALVAKFFAQAGGYNLAAKQVDDLIAEYPERADAVNGLRTQLRQQQAQARAADIELMYRTGAHKQAQAALDELAKDEAMSKALSDQNKLSLQDLRTKYETWSSQLTQAQQFLKDFPKHADQRPQWMAACKVILDELTTDSLGRLKTFLDIAPQHARELKDGLKPTQKTEDVLGLAVSGWLQGDNAAAPDGKAALLLFRAREFVVGYCSADNPSAREQLFTSFNKQNELPLDVMIRLIRMLPPTHAYADQLAADAPTKLSIDLADSNGGKYYLQLPPEYNPQRPYPVILLLHSQREKADALVKRWQEQAGRHGYILAAPIWGQGLRPTYGFTKAEHDVVLDTLRDLRRKFNVDSDRVFLSGWEQGASAAFDIGLAHPDQFAGVMPMNGDVSGFPQKYATNAQYLPFYVVDGDRNGILPRSTRIVFKDWIRGHYPSLYVEYKGRSSEWFGAEMANMLDWMGRKKRHQPLKEMGRYHTGGGTGEEFKTMRTGDNRYYWLSTDEVLDKHINSYNAWSQTARAATLQASVGVVNEESKSGTRIWSQFNIRTFGVKQVTLWIAPNQIDFTRPVVIRVNGTQIGGHRTVHPSLSTLLEELFTTGDRQRLFVAKLDFRL